MRTSCEGMTSLWGKIENICFPGYMIWPHYLAILLVKVFETLYLKLYWDANVNSDRTIDGFGLTENTSFSDVGPCLHILTFLYNNFLFCILHNLITSYLGCIVLWIDGLVWFIVFNATFSNLSVISWRSAL